MPELALIIPAYNEEKNIEKALSGWTAALDRLKIDYQVHIYNDGSKDGTSSAVKRMSENNNRVVFHDQVNMGHGPSILKGYRENLDTEWIFQTDSDNEMSPEYFRLLWEKRKDFDFLLGKRENRESSLIRKLISWTSRLLVWIFYSASIFDVNSPYRLMRTSKFKDLYHAIPQKTFAPNLIVSGFAGLRKMRIFEMPVPYTKRSLGKTTLNIAKLSSSSLRSFLETAAFRLRLIKTGINK